MNSDNSALLMWPKQLLRNAFNHRIHRLQQLQTRLRNLCPHHALVIAVSLLPDELS